MKAASSLMVLGCDPGKTGGAVLVGTSGEIVERWNTPLAGKEYDVDGIRGIVVDALDLFHRDDGSHRNRFVVAIEKILGVVPIGKLPNGKPRWQSPSKARVLTESFAYWHMAAICMFEPVEIVQPKVWQAGIVTGGASGANLKKVWWAEAKRRWPGITAQLADAALIADQTRRRIIGG